MSDAFQERTFVQGRTLEEITATVSAPGGCFDLYRVQHRASFLATDGKLLICWFAAPDAEAVRNALRRMDADSSGIWAGTHYLTSGLTRAELASGNVLIERNFTEPVQLATIQAQELAVAARLATHQVQWVVAFLARDYKRALFVYRAPDTDAVSQALSEAQRPFSNLRAIHTICSPKSNWLDN